MKKKKVLLLVKMFVCSLCERQEKYFMVRTKTFSLFDETPSNFKDYVSNICVRE